MVMVIVLFPSLIATALCATTALAVNSGQGSGIRERLPSAASGRTAASRIPLFFWMVVIMTIKLITDVHWIFGRVGANGSAKIGKLSPCFAWRRIVQQFFRAPLSANAAIFEILRRFISVIR
jgi:hypothetical protein